MAEFIAVVNQKGGVGKTTTTVNLGAALALRGNTVLLVDMDPQAHATLGLGYVGDRTPPTLYDGLFGEASLADVARLTRIDGLSIIPATIDLAGAEMELAALPDRESRLRQLVATGDPAFDFVLIDSPPSLGVLTLNCLVCATRVIIPVQCEYYAIEGLSQILTTVDLLRRSLNPDLRVLGALLTMYDQRTNLCRDVAENLRAKFTAGPVFRSVIPRSIRLAEAPSYGEPIVTYAPDSSGARAYADLADEVIEIVGQEAATRVGGTDSGSGVESVDGVCSPSSD
jgi:chromosome partitioning protein